MNKKVIVFLSIISLTSLSPQISAIAAAKAGGVCSKAGLTSVVSSKTYTCVKSGKKLVWNKGISVSKPGAQNAIYKPGDSCTKNQTSAIKVSDGILYCVPVSDGTFKFIENYSTQPIITNPTSPENLNVCRPPDLRGSVPQGWDRGAITYPVNNHSLVNSGTMNFAIVPMDFPDLPGPGLPSAIYRDEMLKMSKWFDFFSNGNLKIQYQVEDKWHRAPNPSSHYNVGEGIDISVEGFSTQQLMQEYIEATKSTYDYSKVDSILFVYPKEISKIPRPVTRYSSLKIDGKTKGLMLMAMSVQNFTYGPLWLWTAHEMLHHMGLVQHFPVNPPGWGVEWGGNTRSQVLLPWNQSIFNWLNSDQYYCASAENLTNQKITLVPLEQTISGIRTIFIRVSNSEVLMVVSHRKGEWSFDLSESYYGTMVALFDTKKQTDRTAESSDDSQDGVKYSKSGIYLHPINNVAAAKEHVWNQNGAGEWGALMYLGDSITYKGVRIKLIGSNNFDSVEISKD